MRISYSDLVVVADRVEFQIRRAGKWNDDTMSTTYLTELPREFIRIVAGHSAQGLYFIDRDQIQPSEELKSHIFPTNCDNDIYPLNCSG
jgi:Centromere DNA-binding protein complex CBF3 subunit, domain 2